jgi:uncharacterized membrane protein YgdD (TMEM256/DUF423 family)
MNRLLFWGAVMSFLAVAIGAFGAHILEERLGLDGMDTYQTGVQYHAVHGLAMVLAALWAERFPNARLVRLAGWSFLLGIVLFSGSLYVLVMSGIRALGAITPLGGVAFLAGWGMLAAAALKLGKK